MRALRGLEDEVAGLGFEGFEILKIPVEFTRVGAEESIAFTFLNFKASVDGALVSGLGTIHYLFLGRRPIEESPDSVHGGRMSRGFCGSYNHLPRRAV